jgi:hypothetical protein
LYLKTQSQSLPQSCLTTADIFKFLYDQARKKINLLNGGLTKNPSCKASAKRRPTSMRDNTINTGGANNEPNSACNR